MREFSSHQSYYSCGPSKDISSHSDGVKLTIACSMSTRRLPIASSEVSQLERG